MNSATTVHGIYDGGNFTGLWFFSAKIATEVAAKQNAEFRAICQDGGPDPLTVRPVPKPATKL